MMLGKVTIHTFRIWIKSEAIQQSSVACKYSMSKDMDNFSVPLHQDSSPNQHCATLYQCGYPSSEGYNSLSPASSTDSCEESPPYLTYSASQETYGNIPPRFAQKFTSRSDFKCATEKKNKKNMGKQPYGQQKSASEREKLRMRTLSKAFQNLRQYLPASVAPIDKTLTKIETLQLTIRYILHLSAQLGLTEEILEQRRLAGVKRTNSCPSGISCCMDISHRLCTGTEGHNFNFITAPIMQDAETRRFPDETGLPNRGTRCQLPNEASHLLEKRVTSALYTDTSTPTESMCYATCLQQMIHCEDYFDFAELWRRENSDTLTDRTYQ